MAHPDADQQNKFRRPESRSGSGGPIPPRGHYRPPVPAIARAVQPSLKTHTIRLVVATVLGVGLMLVLLKLATLYLQRDWTQKTRRAQTARAQPPAAKPVAAAAETPPGRAHAWRPGATRRQMARLTGDAAISNAWIVLARGLSDKTDPRLVIAGLRLAMASGGESVEIRNDLGAAYLRQNKPREAREQLRAADQIQPGFAPTLYNLALCAIAERQPEQAVQWLGRYLGQRPDDIVALRLQSSLLARADRTADALRMLEKFLKNQPPEQPLFLEAAALAARLGQRGNALRYLETALNGNPIESAVRTYQSAAFREIRLSGEGDPLAARMAAKARTAFGSPVIPVEEIRPMRAGPSREDAP